MKGAREMEVFWCPTWRTAGGVSASGVTCWAWRGIKVKAWPNCVLANKDQLGHRKRGWGGKYGENQLGLTREMHGGWEHWEGTYRSLGLESVMGKIPGALWVVNVGRRGALWAFFPSPLPVPAALNATKPPGSRVNSCNYIEIFHSCLKAEASCPGVVETVRVLL